MKDNLIDRAEIAKLMNCSLSMTDKILNNQSYNPPKPINAKAKKYWYDRQKILNWLQKTTFNTHRSPRKSTEKPLIIISRPIEPFNAAAIAFVTKPIKKIP